MIGNYTGARDALRDAENSMFLEGKDPKTALKEASSNATVGDRRLQLQDRRVGAGGWDHNGPERQPRSSTGTYGRLVAPV